MKEFKTTHAAFGYDKHADIGLKDIIIMSKANKGWQLVIILKGGCQIEYYYGEDFYDMLNDLLVEAQDFDAASIAKLFALMNERR